MTDHADRQRHLAEGDRAHAESRWLNAVEHYGAAGEFIANDVERFAKLGFAFSQLDRYDDARDVFQSLWSKQPSVAKWPYLLGYQYHDSGDWKNALDWYSKALALDQGYLLVHYRAAYCCHKLGELNRALGHLTSFIEGCDRLSESEQLRFKVKLAVAHLRLGKILLEKKLRNVALRSFRRASETDPELGEAHYWFGKTLIDAGQYEAAIQELQLALKYLGPKDYVLAELGEALILAGNYHEAERVYMKIPRHRLKPYVLRQIGELYLQMGRVKDAISALQVCLRKDSQNHKAMFLLAKAYLESACPERATSELRHAIEVKQALYGRSFPEAEELLHTIEPLLSSRSDVDVQLGSANIGRVESFNNDRGFGFIRALSGEKVFFHCSEWPRREPVILNKTVEYEVVSTPKGLKAVGIVLLKDADIVA